MGKSQVKHSKIHNYSPNKLKLLNLRNAKLNLKDANFKIIFFKEMQESIETMRKERISNLTNPILKVAS